VAVLDVELADDLAVVLLGAVDRGDLGDLAHEVVGVHALSDLGGGDLLVARGQRADEAEAGERNERGPDDAGLHRCSPELSSLTDGASLGAGLPAAPPPRWAGLPTPRQAGTGLRGTARSAGRARRRPRPRPGSSAPRPSRSSGPRPSAPRIAAWWRRRP